MFKESAMKAACSYPTEPGARMYKAAIDKINADNHTKSTPHAALARKGVSDSDDLLHRSSCSAGSLAAAATAHPRSSAPWSDAPPLAPRSEVDRVHVCAKHPASADPWRTRRPSYPPPVSSTSTGAAAQSKRATARTAGLPRGSERRDCSAADVRRTGECPIGRAAHLA